MRVGTDVVRRTSKAAYGRYQCDICAREYVTIVRRRKRDNCGCRGNNFSHAHEIGGKPSPELKAYRKMRERCLNATCRDFPNYGGRGITVCQRWLDNFEAFFADLGPKPSPKHSIERRNVNGPYNPSNCYWATKHIQSRNTRRNVYVRYLGQRMIIGDVLKEAGISRTTFYRNKKRLGLSTQATLDRMAGGGS